MYDDDDDDDDDDDVCHVRESCQNELRNLRNFFTIG